MINGSCSFEYCQPKCRIKCNFCIHAIGLLLVAFVYLYAVSVSRIEYPKCVLYLQLIRLL